MLEVTSQKGRTCVCPVTLPAPSVCEVHGVGSWHISSVSVLYVFGLLNRSILAQAQTRGPRVDQIKIPCWGIASSSDVCTHACRRRLN